MRQKRIKSYRKVMQLYCSSFQFREPYQLLVDAAFIRSCVSQKLDFQARLEDVCQGLVKPMITQCSMQALYDLGVEGQASVDLAKEFERRKCSHFKVRPEQECLLTMAGAENKNRYVIATQSLELRKLLRKVAGLPIIYINRSVVLLEAPSEQTLSRKKLMENIKLHAPAAELALLAKSSVPDPTSLNLITGSLPFASTSTLSSTDIATTADLKDSEQVEVDVPKKRKVKGPKGPNPLSVKKKASNPSTSASAAAKKRLRGENGNEGKEVEREKKRPRVDDEKGRSTTMAKRGVARGAGAEDGAAMTIGTYNAGLNGDVAAGVGEVKKKKRSRGKKAKTTKEGEGEGSGTAKTTMTTMTTQKDKVPAAVNAAAV